MNRPQKIIAVLYCLLVVYCCVWVPLKGTQYRSDYIRRVNAGYYLLWDAAGAGTTFDLNLPVIGLRLLAVTALAGAAFSGASLWNNRK